MTHDTFGLIRVLLLFLLIYIIVIGCIVETTPAEIQMETSGGIGITPGADGDPEMTGTDPADLATIATEPVTEVPAESWQSLGTFELTAYCPCEKCCGRWAVNRPTDSQGNTIVYTSTGAVAKAGTTIAVDPSIIPYGSEIQINGHIYIAQDSGGTIKGNRIDIYFNTHQEALEFGRQRAEIFIKTKCS